MNIKTCDRVLTLVAACCFLVILASQLKKENRPKPIMASMTISSTAPSK